MKSIGHEKIHEFKLSIEKFSIFVTACLLSMKERASKQEGVCERKMKMLKDEKILKEKLVQYEKKGLHYYSNSENKQVFFEEETKKED